MHATTRLRPARPAAILLAALLAAGLLAPGCAHRKAAATSDASSVLTAGGFQFVHDDWAKVGYRLDWVGFPFLGERKNPEVRIIKAYDDLLIAQDRQSTVAA